MQKPKKPLDVRTLIPIRRHQKLLQLFKDLPAGDSFVFINDHDPKPLYYEFRSIYGDVVDWEYLQRDPEEWKVRVSRTEPSKGRTLEGASTLMDLRKTAKKDWKYAVFHRYGMMLRGDTMEIIAAEDPEEIHTIFENKFQDEYRWSYLKKEAGEYIIHITKQDEADPVAVDVAVIKKFDVRPHPPARRHDMVFDAFDALSMGEAFVFINDHDPKPLYYQLEAESTDPFKWEYLETLPGEWKVKVTKVAS
ncbi:DUF2249 domain-containing protein [Fodinibius sediminis]|uniref:Uncharacterized conserved protein, DUF2249 family n=1 Tax=Fodinibius sediminis TaxID=1214077 RepID=A0A521BKW9_9BACT|nr:DUF2249 domain-containing protein [Fodinibius sediminis]SMO47725.1 Uncharacterized conserved protein, DUF2249 family [Fodinibius sediminis]